mmetsp:Transcript_25560/g.101905  ORF Transcript_25560/g.101905 Transcript_25560/m.101905 type:complete len:141 (-) Transcript_25560:189-611(-)
MSCIRHRLFVKTPVRECHARPLAVENASPRIATPFHGRKESRQNLERVSRSTKCECSSPRSLGRQDDSGIDWLATSDVSPDLIVQAVGRVELLEEHQPSGQLCLCQALAFRNRPFPDVTPMTSLHFKPQRIVEVLLHVEQ